MNYIDKKLIGKTENISFIQIKEDSNLKVKGIDLTNMPLPILMESLIKEVKSKAGEEISLERVVDGIIYLLGIGDEDFPYIGKYKDLIEKLPGSVKEKILYDSMESFKNDDIDMSLIYVRALLNLEPENIKALFQYGLVLEKIGMDLLEQEESENGEEVLKLSTSKFEKILDIDEEHDLAYYKLGFHYRHLSQYVKADLIWNKFLKYSSNDNLKEEVRDELSIISDEVNFETAITYLTYGDFQKALDSLIKLLPVHEESWNVNYLLGKAYNGIGDMESAIEYFKRAIEYNKEEMDLYNELGALYYSMGNVNEAIDIFSKGLKQDPKDHKLLYNRSIMYSATGENEKALSDAEEAYSIEKDENIKNHIYSLKSLI